MDMEQINSVLLTREPGLQVRSLLTVALREDSKTAQAARIGARRREHRLSAFAAYAYHRKRSRLNFVETVNSWI